MRRKKKAAGFSVGEYVVYPSHGVGRVERIETQEIAGTRMELIVISIEKEQMTLSVPVGRVIKVGLRSLTTQDDLMKTLRILNGRARVKKSMWSKRAQEYDQKINSGDIKELTEVVRDLHRHDKQKEQSYSERQLYESAYERLSREIAAVYDLTIDDAGQMILKELQFRRSGRNSVETTSAP